MSIDSLKKLKLEYCIFLDYNMHSPQIWEENGGASYSLNVAEGVAMEQGFFFLFSSSKT